MNTNNLFIISGSKGWLSYVFKEKLQNSEHKVIKISNSKDWKNIYKINLNEFHKIFLIHNGFVDHRNNKLTDSEYEEILFKNFEILEDFLLNNKITGLFYPSTGKIYFENKNQLNKQYIYSKQKIFEENKIKELANKRNYSYIISRIFSPIGPINNFKLENSINSILKDAIVNRKIEIKSQTNDIHSISIIDNLVALIIELFLKESENKQDLVFDVVDTNISLLDLSYKIVNSKNLSDVTIDYNFSPEKKINTYIGNDEVYKKLKNDYLLNIFDIETYIQKLLI